MGLNKEIIHGICPECGYLLIVKLSDLILNSDEFICPNCKTELDLWK